MTIDPLLDALRYAADPPSNVPLTKLATVTATSASGVTVRFDGESTASSRLYRTTASVTVGQRVLMTRVGSTYVCTGSITTRGPRVLSRAAGNLVASANAPNDGVVRTCYIAQGVTTVPQGAQTALVSMHGNAMCPYGNAAMHWIPQVSWNNGTVSWEIMHADSIAHNNGNLNVPMTMGVTTEHDVSTVNGATVALAINISNDSGSAGWIALGVYANWAISFKGAA